MKILRAACPEEEPLVAAQQNLADLIDLLNQSNEGHPIPMEREDLDEAIEIAEKEVEEEKRKFAEFIGRPRRIDKLLDAAKRVLDGADPTVEFAPFMDEIQKKRREKRRSRSSQTRGSRKIRGVAQAADKPAVEQEAPGQTHLVEDPPKREG